MSSGPSILIEPDGLGVDAADRFRRRAFPLSARDRRRRRSRHQRGIDVDLLHHLAAVLRPFHVEADGDEQDDADDRVVRLPGMPIRTRPLISMKMMIAPIIARHTVPRPPATDAPPRMTAVSAWISQRRRWSNPCCPGARRRRCRRRRRAARQHIGREQHALDVDAGMARRLAAGADRGQMPA